jgi:hypothetical protein
MACTKDDAIFRLLAAWCANVVEDATQGDLVDIVTPELIHAVQRGDLFREFSEHAKLNRLAELRDEERQRVECMNRAWRAPAPSGRQ